MRLETRIEVLQNLTEEQWECILDATHYVPHPGRFIIVPELHRVPLRPWLPVDPENIKLPSIERASNDRRLHILKRLAEGATGKTVAAELGISQSLLSKIKKGERR